jgi:RND family efflux transporter MFP subunit
MRFKVNWRAFRFQSQTISKSFPAGRFLACSSAILFALVILSCNRKKNAAPPPPPSVEVITVSARDVPIFMEWIGTLDGSVNAEIRAQVSGYIQTQNYMEGSQVKSNQLLFQIDPRPFEVTLAQSKAKLAQDEAQLGKTDLDVKRLTPLAKVKAISQEELDNAVASNRAARAQVDADNATIEGAQLNLGFTKIKSPIDGLAGNAQAQIGDLVGPNGPLLTRVSTVDPIKVYFTASEQSYLTYRRQYANPTQREAHERELELELILADGSIYPQKGKFFTADREVNMNTGTLRLTGLAPNPHFLLRPGQFCRVRAMTSTRKGALVVPPRAVTELQGSYQVATIDGQNKVHIQPVKVGDRLGSDWIIEQGLKPGDKVIAEGAQKVHEGLVVNPQPFIPQKFGTNPPQNQASNP